MPDPLQPCPFCGGAAEIVKRRNVTLVWCNNKGCRSAAVSARIEKRAIAKWNTRAQPTGGERG